MNEFYKDKQVVVTGGCGMVGHQLVKRLLQAEAVVTVIDNESRGTQHVEGARYFPPRVSDAREIPFLEFVFSGEKVDGKPVDIVFNLAASVGGILHNMDNQVAMLKENMELQVNPIVAAERAGVQSFVQVSSVCVYGPEYNNPAMEEYGLEGMPHAANFGYAWSKRVGEMMAFASDIPFVVTARPSNVFGLHDYFDERSHVIPALIDRIAETKDGDIVELFGNMDYKREFIYSTDVADGLVAIGAKGDDRQAYNIGCGGQNVITIRQLAIMIGKLMGKKVVPFSSSADQGGDPVRYSDVIKIFNDTGWTHRVSLKEGLKEVIEWRKTELSK